MWYAAAYLYAGFCVFSGLDLEKQNYNALGKLLIFCLCLIGWPAMPVVRIIKE